MLLVFHVFIAVAIMVCLVAVMVCGRHGIDPGRAWGRCGAWRPTSESGATSSSCVLDLVRVSVILCGV